MQVMLIQYTFVHHFELFMIRHPLSRSQSMVVSVIVRECWCGGDAFDTFENVRSTKAEILRILDYCRPATLREGSALAICMATFQICLFLL
jgi:hypothetical protein